MKDVPYAIVIPQYNVTVSKWSSSLITTI